MATRPEPQTTCCERQGMMGDGCIEPRRPREAVDAADSGYTGPIEAEVFSGTLWAMPGEDVLALAVGRNGRHVA